MYHSVIEGSAGTTCEANAGTAIGVVVNVEVERLRSGNEQDGLLNAKAIGVSIRWRGDSSVRSLAQYNFFPKAARRPTREGDLRCSALRYLAISDTGWVCDLCSALRCGARRMR